MANSSKVVLTNQYGEQSINTIIPQGGTGVDNPLFVLPNGNGIFSGEDAPAFSAAAGSIYVRVNGASGSQVVYVNNAEGNNWAALVTA